MTYVRKFSPYRFRDRSHQSLVEEINDDIPISLEHSQDLVGRVCDRYPYLPKYQSATIVKATFSTIRDLLILGNTLNFTRLFNLVFLLIKPKLPPKSGYLIKFAINTPPRLRKLPPKKVKTRV